MPPNILLITADHMRSDALACNAAWSPASSLAHVIQTPHLDRLAREGVTFASAFTPNPICVPARAAITSGNYPHKCTGVKSNKGSIRGDQPKLAELFARNGYATYAIGKLHYVPYAPPGQPRLLHGFQYAELNEEGRILKAYDPEGEIEGLEEYHDYLKSVGWAGYERAHGLGNNDVHPAPSPMPADQHEEAWVARRTIAALERHAQEKAGQPFLVWASFSKPHSPYDPPRPYDAMYDPRHIPQPMGDWDDEELLQGRDLELIRRRVIYGWERLSAQAVQVIRAHYAGLVSFQDALIGQIIAWLDGAGLLEESIIVYTSDHGDLLGDFGRFYKTCMFDAAVRVPMIWRVPGLIPGTGSRVRRQMAGLQDILPSLCALTDTRLSQPVDGVDLTPILADPSAPGREVYVAQTSEPRGGGQKYMVRTADWKYVYTEVEGREELYEVRDGQGEMHNRAHDPACTSIREELRDYLVRWCAQRGDQDMLRNGQLAHIREQDLPPAEFSVDRLGWRRF